MKRLLVYETRKLLRNKWLYVIPVILFVYYTYYNIFPIYKFMHPERDETLSNAIIRKIVNYYAKTDGHRISELSHEAITQIVNYPEIYLLRLSSFVLPIFYILLICLVFTDDFDTGAIKISLFQGYSRKKVYQAKLVVFFAAVFGMFFSSLIISYCLGLIFVAFGANIDIWKNGFIDFQVFLRAVCSHLLVFINFLPFSSVGILMGLFMRERIKASVLIMFVYIIDNVFTIPYLGFSYYLRRGLIYGGNTMSAGMESRHMIFYMEGSVRIIVSLTVCFLYCIIYYLICKKVFNKIEIR